MLWSFRDLNVTLGSLSHYARDLDLTLKPDFLRLSWHGSAGSRTYVASIQRLASGAPFVYCCTSLAMTLSAIVWRYASVWKSSPGNCRWSHVQSFDSPNILLLDKNRVIRDIITRDDFMSSTNFKLEVRNFCKGDFSQVIK